jgi:hypothetical protein
MIIQELINLIGFKVDEGQLTAAERRISVAANGIEQIGKRLSMFLTLPILAMGGVMLKLASDSEEIKERFDTIFGDLAKSTDEWAIQFADSVGRSGNKVRKGLSDFQTMMVGIGMGKDQAAGMSKKMQQLVYDFASFNHVTDDEAVSQFTMALTGMARGLKRYGINLKEPGQEVDAFGNATEKAAKRIDPATQAIKSLSEIEKVMARQGAIGAAERHLGDFGHRLEQIKSLLSSIYAKFGMEIMPAVNKFITKFIPFLKYLRDMDSSGKRLILVIGGIVAAIGPMIIGFALLVKLGLALKTTLAGLFLISKGGIFTIIAGLGKFFLIGAAIVAVIAAIALAVEDVITYMAGGKSVIGKFLEPWSTLGPKIKESLSSLIISLQTIFTTIIDIARNAVGFIISLLSGDALTASLNLQKLIDNILILIGGLMVTLVQMLIAFGPTIWQVLVFGVDKFCRFIYNLFYSVFDTILSFITSKIKGIVDLVGPLAGKAWKGISEGAQSFNSALGGMTPGFYSSPFTPALASAGGGTSKQQSLNVNSVIQMTVPEGTPEQQVQHVQKAAEKAVKDELGKEMRNVLINFPDMF